MVLVSIQNDGITWDNNTTNPNDTIVFQERHHRLQMGTR
jgi:hypothetical protein